MNLKNQLSKDQLATKKSDIKKIFFFRICGTGMGTTAILLKSAGYYVEGYDMDYFPPMSTYLESTGIPLHREIYTQKLQEFDLIVTGNVVRKDCDDAHMIEESGVPFASFPSTLGALILDDLEVVGIAGTHGKTTTTYLATQVYENLGEDPGYFIGGVLENLPSARIGKGKFFIESDEYDSAYFEKISKFRKYSLNHMVLTSLEFDHADIFNTIDDIIEQFKSVLPEIDGEIITNNHYDAVNRLHELEISPANWTFYGEESPIGPHIISMSSDGTTLKLTSDKDYIFQTNLTGFHNILNLTSVILLALKDGFTIEQINNAIKNLEMVKRRQEYRGTYNGSIVIDDFAHHPRAVEMTIDAIGQKYPNKNIITFMEPRSATARSDIFQNEFALSLKKSHKVVILQPNPTTVKFANDLDTKKMVEDLTKMKIDAQIVDKLAELMKVIDENATDNNLLLFLSNATCLGLWKSDFVNNLK
jgi:UDP-N-acetylmuramate: L-alanyl-gamma-D-glutamyl-meso-diaminopimelate ligase